MVKPARETSIVADPTQWSEKSKQSVSFDFRKEYSDIEYTCWRCNCACVFTAQDQKYTFEVKKASIDQGRRLCGDCWSESHRVRADLADCADQWASAKSELQRDAAFLGRWLELLLLLDEYAPYKPDTARKNMLRKLLDTPPPGADR